MGSNIVILFFIVIVGVLWKLVMKLIKWLKEPIVYELHLPDGWEIKKKKHK